MTRPGPARRLRVVAHNGSAILGGGEIAVAQLLGGLQERGHRVTMLCRDARIAERVAGYGIPTGVLHVGGDVMLHDALRFAAAMRRLRPDVVLLTTFRKLVLAGLGARLARVPFVVQRVGLSTDVPRGVLYRLALRRFVDQVVVNAEEMRAGFLAGDPRLDPARVATVLNAVRPPARHAGPGSLRRALGIPPEAPVVGAVGRLARQKRFDRLLRVLAALPADVHCVLAGEGEDEPALRALAERLGVTPRLHLLGFRADVGDVLDALDVFVLCSEREGMANAMLEAMAAGVVVVSTEVSGANQALDAEGAACAPGVVVESEEEMRDAVAALLADPARREAMGRAARERAERRFGREHILDAWEALLAGGVQAATRLR